MLYVFFHFTEYIVLNVKPFLFDLEGIAKVCNCLNQLLRSCIHAFFFDKHMQDFRFYSKCGFKRKIKFNFVGIEKAILIDFFSTNEYDHFFPCC